MDIETTDEESKFGFVWGDNGQFTYLVNRNERVLRIPETDIRDIELLAAGELDPDDLSEELREKIDSLAKEGYFHEGEIMELSRPDDIGLLGRGFISLSIVAVSFFFLVSLSVDIFGAAMSGNPPSIGLLALGTAAMIPLLLIHEWGHYAVARRHIATSIGLGSINGIVPVAITDTTQSWILSRNRRIWINMAGSVAQFAATIPIVGLHYAGVAPEFTRVAIALSSSMIVFSLNPLFHGDGYLIAMDLLNETNIRSQANQDLADLELTPYSVYGVLSYGYALFSVLAMIVVAWLFYGVVGVGGSIAFLVVFKYADVSESRLGTLTEHKPEWLLEVRRQRGSEVPDPISVCHDQSSTSSEL